MIAEIDYCGKAMTIQSAMLDLHKRFPNKSNRPESILWAGHRVKTGDQFLVPENGIVRGEIISVKGEFEQGFDISVEGWLKLADGAHVKTLRTWNDPRYVPFVEYPFYAEDGLMRVWNVYRMRYPGGQVIEEKWTGNAGFWLDIVNQNDRIYHCSPGMMDRPDFESFVFRISVQPG